MSNTGTNEAERGLNIPKSEEELADQILTAVSENNDEEMDRLFSVGISPDAEPEETEDSEEDSPEDEGKDDSDKGPDDQTAADESEEDEEEDASTTTHEPDPAAERIAQLEHKLHNAEAAVGRMASMQSRLAQLERQLKQQAEASTKSKEKEAADTAEKNLRERIGKLKEIDPDTAEILETMLEQRQKESPKQQAQGPQANHADVSEEYYKLLNVHPDADTIFKHPSWHAWKNTLTPQQLAWASSNKAEHVAEALNAYKQYMQGFGKQHQQPVEQEGTPPTADVVDATKQARERKLQRSADSSDKPMKKQPKFDESRFFEEAYEKIAKEAGINY